MHFLIKLPEGIALPNKIEKLKFTITCWEWILTNLVVGCVPKSWIYSYFRAIVKGYMIISHDIFCVPYVQFNHEV